MISRDKLSVIIYDNGLYAHIVSRNRQCICAFFPPTCNLWQHCWRPVLLICFALAANESNNKFTRGVLVVVG